MLLRKALLILSGNAAASFLLMLRNLIVARLIPVEDYGIAATFALAMAVVEMASVFGLHQQIVQAKEGDDPHFQAALQGFQLLRGLASGAILFLLAGPLAQFMGIPQVAWAYQVLAIVPVLNALVHFDIHRLNRQMRFGPLLWNGILPALASLLLIYPLVHWFGDWRVMLWAILAQAAAATLTSHLMAERRWRIVFDPSIISSSIRFGWPIMVNAILLFLVFQGDKLIIGRLLGMEALAIFAMGLTFTLTPTLVLAKSAQNFFLPRISTAVGTTDYAPLALRTMHSIALAALAFVSLTFLLGAPLVLFLLGEKYADLVPLILWFAIGQGLRVMKAGPAIVALAIGQTANAMIANLLRILALPFAVIAAVNGANLLDLLLIGIVAEGLGFMISIWLVLRKSELSRTRTLLPFATVVLVGMVVAVASWRHPVAGVMPDAWLWLLGVSGFLCATMMVYLCSGWRQKQDKA